MSGVARRRSSSPRGRSGRPRTQQPAGPVYATVGELTRLEARVDTIAAWGPTLQEIHDALHAIKAEVIGLKTFLAQSPPPPQGQPQSRPQATGANVHAPQGTTSYGRSGHEVKIETRGIEKYRKFAGVPAEYDDWRDQDAEHACFGNPELGELLKWAEEQPDKITEVDESIKSTDANITYDVQAVSCML